VGTLSSLTVTNDASISGLTVGKGGGSNANNTVLGNNGALSTNSTGTGLTAVGGYTLKLNTADYNSAFGWSALQANTSGTQNAAFGTSDATWNATLGSNTTGSYNNAFGNGALARNTTGANNTALGHMTLNANTTASNNTAVGYQAGYSNTTATGQTALGYQALFSSNRTADANAYNTAVGYQAGYSVSTGQGNVFIGNGSGTNMTTGSNNVIVGGYTGNNGALDMRTLSNYIMLSDGAGNARGIFDNNGNYLVGGVASGVTNVGFQVQIAGNGANKPAVASSGATAASGDVTWMVYSTTAAQYQFYVNYAGTVFARSTSITGLSDVSEKENIKPLETGLNEILALQPRRFDWKNGSSKNVAGFIAQEVETVLPDLVEEYKIDDENFKKGLKMGDMIPTLVKAIQELKAEFDAYKATHP
jgi:hypothetical protein